MAQQKAKGSIIYELLIVILIVGLVGTILYPKSVWEEEAAKTKLCRERMTHLVYAEALYRAFTNTYTDSIPELVNFILNDTTLERLHQFVMSDSVLTGNIIRYAQDNADAADIIDAIRSGAATLEGDTVAINYLSLERLNQRLPSLPMDILLGEWRVKGDSTLLIDTLIVDIPLKAVLDRGGDLVSNTDLIKTLWFVAIEIEEEEHPEDWIWNLLRLNPRLSFISDSISMATVQTFSRCPTVGDSLIVTVVDTSEVKHLIIACPIDATHISRAQEDFLRSKIGGLKIANHGKIEDDQPSWTTLK